jgi:hypothetical protein
MVLLFYDIDSKYPPYSFIWPYSFNWHLRVFTSKKGWIFLIKDLILKGQGMESAPLMPLRVNANFQKTPFWSILNCILPEKEKFKID